MNLILLQPGEKDFLKGKSNDWIKDKFNIDPSILGSSPCIQLSSFHQGMKQQMTTDISNSARTSSRPILTDFTCTKDLDETSIKFYEYCLKAKTLGSGNSQPTKIFLFTNVGEANMNILTFELRDAMINGVDVQSDDQNVASEQFKLNFTEILWSYSSPNDPEPQLTSGWSVARNRPISSFSL